MKNYIKVILIAITIMVFTTCKKYPEGGWSNVAIKHLFGGHHKGSSKTWHLKKYEVNGIDSTEFIKAGNGVTAFENEQTLFKYNGSFNNNADSKVYHYGLSISKTKNTLTFNGGSYSYGTNTPQCYKGISERSIFNPSIEKPYVVWQIIKLKNEELIISALNNGNNYKIILRN